MNDLTNIPWCETRIFSPSTAPGQSWYFDILREFICPFRDAFPGLRFWFTRYECANENNPIAAGFALPDRYWLDTTNGKRDGHRSVELRFEDKPETRRFVLDQVRAVCASDFILEPIAHFNPVTGFATASAFSSTSAGDRAGRANILGHLLWWNCLLVLHACKADKRSFEHNPNPDCGVLGTSFRFPLHMQHNVYGCEDGGELPLLILTSLTHGVQSWNSWNRP